MLVSDPIILDGNGRQFGYGAGMGFWNRGGGRLGVK